MIGYRFSIRTASLAPLETKVCTPGVSSPVEISVCCMVRTYIFLTLLLLFSLGTELAVTEPLICILVILVGILLFFHSAC